MCIRDRPLGDVTDEIRLLMDVNGNNKFIVSINDTLYRDGKKGSQIQLKIQSWDYLLYQLIEAGILIKQNMKNERISCVNFNVALEDVRRAIDQDEILKDL